MSGSSVILVVPLRKAWSETAREAALEARRAAGGTSKPKGQTKTTDRAQILKDKISRAAKTAASLELKARQMDNIADKYHHKDAGKEMRYRSAAIRSRTFAELNLNGVRQFTRELRSHDRLMKERGGLFADRDAQDAARLREVGV